MQDLTAFQRDLLYVIAGLDRSHGSRIQSELQAHYESDILSGRFYSNLTTLVEEQLIEKGQQDGRTNYYAITDRGVHEIQERREWEDNHLGDDWFEDS